MNYLVDISLFLIYMILVISEMKGGKQMSLIIVLDKQSNKKKCLYTRREAVDWLLSVNPEVPEKDLMVLEARSLINKYAPDNYTILVNY